jgi:hypothetical protein
LRVLPLSDTNPKPTTPMKTKYAVKHQLSNHHTGRVHDTMNLAIRDLVKCQKAAKSGLGDDQGISIVAVEGDDWRNLTEVEMDDFATRCFEAGIEA